MMGQMYNYIQKGVDYMPGLFSISLLRNAGGCGMGPSKSFTMTARCRNQRECSSEVDATPLWIVGSREVEWPSLKASYTDCKKQRIVEIFRNALP